MIFLWQLCIYSIFQAFCLCILCPDKIMIIIFHWVQKHSRYSFFPSHLPCRPFTFSTHHPFLEKSLFCLLFSRHTHLSARLYPVRLRLYFKAEVFQLLCPSETLVWFKHAIAFLRARHRRFIATGAIHLTWALNAGERRQLKARDAPVRACRCNGPRRVDLKAH